MSAERAERERIAAEALRASLWATLCDHEESDPYDAAGPNGGLVIVPTDTVRALCDAVDEVERLRKAVAERDTRLAETIRYHDARVNRADEATDASRTAHAALDADLRALHRPRTTAPWLGACTTCLIELGAGGALEAIPAAYPCATAAVLDRHASTTGETP